MDPHSVLGIPRKSSLDDIKKAYKRKALTHHPDRGGNPEEFKRIREAYDTLCNPEPRVKKQDHCHTLHVSMDEAYRGVTRPMRVTVNKQCLKCVKLCDVCQGRGSVMQEFHLGPFIQHMMVPCTKCTGQGKISGGCSECNRSGRVVTEHPIEVKIPRGASSAVFEGFGEQPTTPNEDPGDLIIKIEIKSHPAFMLVKEDLVWCCEISFEDSVRGAQIICPHFDGPLVVDTSAWGVLDPRADYTVPGKGFTKHGFLKILFNIKYPPRTTKFQLIPAAQS